MRRIHRDRSSGLYVYQDKDETLDYEFDWSAWLNGDTIDTVSNEASGVTITTSSNTTTANIFWVRGTNGYVTSTITTAAGRIKQKTLTFREKIA